MSENVCCRPVLAGEKVCYFFKRAVLECALIGLVIIWRVLHPHSVCYLKGRGMCYVRGCVH